MENIKYWLIELSYFDEDGGRYNYEEALETYENIMDNLITSAESTKNKELERLVRELVGIYENSGYYDYGGEKEKSELRDQIYLIIEQSK